MEVVLVKLLLAPALVGAASLAAWRFGSEIGGWLSGLPVVAGPVLLIADLEHGERFAALTASGVLLELVALSAFIATYGLLARRAPIALCLVAGWLVCGAATLALHQVRVDAGVAAAAALVSFAAVSVLLPATPAATRTDAPRDVSGVMTRMATTAALVAALTAAAGALGPRTGGVLVALPVLASVLVAYSHREEGADAVPELLRGMLAGLVSFVGFCLVVALWLPDSGTAAAFAAACALALIVQGGTLQLVHVGRFPRRGAGIASSWRPPLPPSPNQPADTPRQRRSAPSARICS